MGSSIFSAVLLSAGRLRHVSAILLFGSGVSLLATLIGDVGVSDRGVLNQLVKVNCVPLIPDGDAKRYKVYTGSGNWCPTSSLRDRSCIPCTEVLVVGGYKLGERGS